MVHVNSFLLLSLYQNVFSWGSTIQIYFGFLNLNKFNILWTHHPRAICIYTVWACSQLTLTSSVHGNDPHTYYIHTYMPCHTHTIYIYALPVVTDVPAWARNFPQTCILRFISQYFSGHWSKQLIPSVVSEADVRKKLLHLLYLKLMCTSNWCICCIWSWSAQATSASVLYTYIKYISSCCTSTEIFNLYAIKMWIFNQNYRPEHADK